MFGGLISYSGVVRNVGVQAGGGARLQIECEGVLEENAEPKDSIAIDGVCLTATRIEGAAVSFDVVPETLACSTLSHRARGDRVNVEYSLRIGDRVGGHFVYGHVDTTLAVLARAREGEGERMRFVRPTVLRAALSQKAFVAIDGVSLTIAAAGDDWFDIAIIPETLSRTTLRERPVGSLVNVEIDPLARYVQAVLALRESAPGEI